ncbi:winged helix DNA-binding domain-containing protein [Paeniglutamicibacter sp. ABSL32-1]|uniref:winged helix DNA-binding domain-containing protein n=1 Tax=Paeniglutamicibacter quisquiliarum TaxID=2849498 RepID=UPI001C2CFAFE|nr:winged helix DNA-binding domain-containing protein [Paeniglutamicibacter quisquiliarum]MBV1779891.1 winged helix DNA-binding domain-containing protein [Paeniglutamicibacter quisquiliarum]
MATDPQHPTGRQAAAVARLRLAAQGLLPGTPAATLPEPAATPADVVGALGMMQAQDLAQACWAVGVRLPGAGLGTIHAALADGSVIRCWGARGTLMFITPRAHRALLAVTAPRMHAKMAAIRAQEGITEAEIGKLADVAAGRCGSHGATRAELLRAFADAGSSTEGQRGYHLIVAVSLRGVIVQGPMEPGSGTRQLFMAADSWLPAGGSPPAASDALARLVRGYFESHGPATVADCAWWLGLPLTPVRAAVSGLGAVLEGLELAGTTYHLAREHRERWDHPPGARSVLALPGFDEFLLGYRDRSATLDADHAQVVTPGKNGIFLRTVVAGGRTIGTWEPGAGGTAPAGRFVPFDGEPGPARARAIADRMASYRRFRLT